MRSDSPPETVVKPRDSQCCRRTVRIVDFRWAYRAIVVVVAAAVGNTVSVWQYIEKFSYYRSRRHRGHEVHRSGMLYICLFMGWEAKTRKNVRMIIRNGI